MLVNLQCDNVISGLKEVLWDKCRTNLVGWVSGVKRFLEFSSQCSCCIKHNSAIFYAFTMKKAVTLSGTQLHNEVWLRKKKQKAQEKCSMSNT